MAEITVKYNQLTPKAELALTDLTGIASSDGILYTATLEKLQFFLSTLDGVSFKGTISAGTYATKDAGWYFASNTGNYVMGSTTIAVDVSDTLTIIIVPSVINDSSKVEIPINITFDTTPTAGSVNAVTSQGIKTYVDNKEVTTDPTPTENGTDAFSTGGAFTLNEKLSKVANLQNTTSIYNQNGTENAYTLIDKTLTDVGDYLELEAKALGLINESIYMVSPNVSIDKFGWENTNTIQLRLNGTKVNWNVTGIVFTDKILYKLVKTVDGYELFINGVSKGSNVLSEDFNIYTLSANLANPTYAKFKIDYANIMASSVEYNYNNIALLSESFNVVSESLAPTQEDLALKSDITYVDDKIQASNFTEVKDTSLDLASWVNDTFYNSSGVYGSTSAGNFWQSTRINVESYRGSKIHMYAWYDQNTICSFLKDENEVVISKLPSNTVGTEIVVDIPLNASFLDVTNFFGSSNKYPVYIYKSKLVNEQLNQNTNDLTTINNSFIDIYREENIATFIDGFEYLNTGVLQANTGGSYAEVDVESYRGKKIKYHVRSGSPYFDLFVDENRKVISFSSTSTPVEVVVPLNAKYLLLSNFWNGSTGVENPFLYVKESLLSKAIGKPFSEPTNITSLAPQSDFDNSNFDWTSTIQAAIDLKKGVYIPYKSTPYVIEGTIILKDDTSIIADRNAIIENQQGLFVLNEKILTGTRNKNITIDGGIWDCNNLWGATNTGTTKIDEGVKTAMGFFGVDDLTLKNMYIVNGSSNFATQFADCEKLNIFNIQLIDCGRDGIHLGGDINNFIIENIYGNTQDDMVALNAWDWFNYTPKYGNITNGVVRNIVQLSGHARTVRVLGGAIEGTKYIVDNVTIENVNAVNHLENITIGFEAGNNNPGVASKIGRIYLKNIKGESTSGFDYPISITSDVEFLSIDNSKLYSDLGGLGVKAGVVVDTLSVKNYTADYRNMPVNKKSNIVILGTVTNLIIDGFVENASATITGGKAIDIRTGGLVTYFSLMNSYFNANEFALFSQIATNTTVKNYGNNFLKTKSSGNFIFIGE
jgi:hypothetical protein